MTKIFVNYYCNFGPYSRTYSKLLLRGFLLCSSLSNRVFQFQQEGDSFAPVVVGRQSLSNMEPGEVIVAKWDKPLKYQYFRDQNYKTFYHS